MVEPYSHLKLLPASTLGIYKVFEHIDMLSMGIGSSLKQLYQHYLGQMWGFWVTCRVKMMTLRHGWSWRPTQTASCIQIIHIQSVWAHWYAVHRHMTIASNSYTVIGHGIGGKVSQLKWRDLLKASRWSKRWWSVVTRSHSYWTSDVYEIQGSRRHILYGIPYVGYPLPHWLKYLTSY